MAGMDITDVSIAKHCVQILSELFQFRKSMGPDWECDTRADKKEAGHRRPASGWNTCQGVWLGVSSKIIF